MVSNPYDFSIVGPHVFFDFVQKENYSTIDSYFYPYIVTPLYRDFPTSLSSENVIVD